MGRKRESKWEAREKEIKTRETERERVHEKKERGRGISRKEIVARGRENDDMREVERGNERSEGELMEIEKGKARERQKSKRERERIK